MQSQEIRKVVKWQNGIVMVFDQFGQQMPGYQGRYEEVREKILAAATDKTEFSGAEWRVPNSETKLNSF